MISARRLSATAAVAAACILPALAPAQTVPAPVLGQTLTVERTAGTVRVSIPPATARPSQRLPRAGTFVPLVGVRQIPVGSFIDTRRGVVTLTSAQEAVGTPQSGRFSSGLFRVGQSARPSAKGLTELRLVGGRFDACPKAGKSSGGEAARRRVVRRLRGNARGRFKGSAKHSSATVRGTTWSIDDRCDTTVTKVRSGVVAVRDFRRRVTVSISPGEGYIACARGFRPKTERSRGRFRTCGRYSTPTVRGG